MWPDLAYAVWQLERGESGTPHYQGYVVFQGKKRRDWCNKHCTKGHWEPRKGSHMQAKDYVTKSETRFRPVRNRRGRSELGSTGQEK